MYILILLLVFAGCTTINKEPYKDTVGAEQFVRKEMQIPNNVVPFYEVKIHNPCYFYQSANEIVIVKGYYNTFTGSLCYDGTGEVYAHEIAHVYGASEVEAQRIAYLYKKEIESQNELSL